MFSHASDQRWTLRETIARPCCQGDHHDIGERVQRHGSQSQTSELKCDLTLHRIKKLWKIAKLLAPGITKEPAPGTLPLPFADTGPASFAADHADNLPGAARVLAVAELIRAERTDRFCRDAAD